MNTPVKVAIKYCGSCNPNIDLPRLARHITSLAGSLGFILVSPGEGSVDILIGLNGCPRACGDSEGATSPGGYHLSIAGESVAGQIITEEVLPQAIEQTLREFLGHQKMQRREEAS